MLQQQASTCHSLIKMLEKNPNFNTTGKDPLCNTDGNNNIDFACQSREANEFNKSVDTFETELLDDDCNSVFTDNCEIVEEDVDLYSTHSPECSICPEYMIQNVCLSDSNEVFFLRLKDSNQTIETFFKFHPCQPKSRNIPFSPKVFLRKDGSVCRWLTYSVNRNVLMCSICLAYAPESHSNKFIDGVNDWRHVFQRIQEHEQIKQHILCTEAHILSDIGVDIRSLVSREHNTVRKRQVEERRCILERIIEVIKHIGKRGLSYRGTSEGAYSLEDESVDHGNFLELLKLLAKFDTPLKR